MLHHKVSAYATFYIWFMWILAFIREYSRHVQFHMTLNHCLSELTYIL